MLCPCLAIFRIWCVSRLLVMSCHLVYFVCHVMSVLRRLWFCSRTACSTIFGFKVGLLTLSIAYFALFSKNLSLYIIKIINNWNGVWIGYWDLGVLIAPPLVSSCFTFDSLLYIIYYRRVSLDASCNSKVASFWPSIAHCLIFILVVFQVYLFLISVIFTLFLYTLSFR